MADRRPETAVQLLALPEGPAFGMHEHVVTPEERARGCAWVFGRHVTIPPAAAARIRVPVAPDLVAFASEVDDLLAATDPEGQRWTLGRYADGTWFRKREG